MGQAGTLAGFGRYLAAPAVGPLALVQPIMVLGLVLGAVTVGARTANPTGAAASASATGVLHGANAAVTELLADDLTRGAAATA